MRLALYGYGGHAREVTAQINKPITYFVDDQYINKHTKSISSFDPNKYKMMIAIANPKARFDAVQKLPKETEYFTFIHPTTLILDDNIEIKEGSFIGAYSILTTNIKIGRHAILNRGNHIGHDTVIGDYFSAMPGSIISGNVTIGNNVYLGTNSSIREKIIIQDSITIGLNSGVIKNIYEPGVYVGTPTKKVK